MEEKENIMQKYSGWLVPVLAILVIFQTVVLISQQKEEKPTVGYIPVSQPEVVKEASVSLAFVPSGASLKKGQTATFDLFLTPKRPLRLDGADVVLGFDPEVLQITQVNTPKLFSLVSQRKENESKGRISLTFLEEQAGGILIDKEAKLLSLTVKGKVAGESGIFITTADQGPSTVLTESGTSKKILFEKGSLKVVVY